MLINAPEIIISLLAPFFLMPGFIVTLLEQSPIETCQFFAVLVCAVGLESYTLHRMIKVPCTQAVPRMIIINLIKFLAQSIIGILILITFNMATFMKFERFFRIPDIKTISATTINQEAIMSLIFGVVFASILFITGVLIASKAYQLFDKKIDKAQLKKAMLRANFISYSFVTLVFLTFIIADKLFA